MTIEQTIDILPDHRLELALPIELPVGRARVELVITPEIKKTTTNSSAFGCLNRFADPSKIPGEEGAWARVIQEKYEKN
jgi:hypothetical protein